MPFNKRHGYRRFYIHTKQRVKFSSVYINPYILRKQTTWRQTHLMSPEVSLQCSEDPAPFSYPEDGYRAHSMPSDSFNLYFGITVQSTSIILYALISSPITWAKCSAHLILTQRMSLSNELIVPATSPHAEANGTTLVGRPEIEPRVVLSM